MHPDHRSSNLFAPVALALIVAISPALKTKRHAFAAARGIETPMTLAQAKCAAANYKALRLLSKTITKHGDLCLGLKAREVGVDECLEALDARFGKFTAKATKILAKACDGQDKDGLDRAAPFGTASIPPDAADIAVAADAGARASIAESYGEIATIDDRLLALDGSAAVIAAFCQAKVQKAQSGCARQVLADFAACAKLGLAGDDKNGVLPFTNDADLAVCLGADLKGKIAKACDPETGKVTAAYEKFCAGIGADTSAAMPDCEADTDGIAVCLGRAAACNACQAAAATAGLDPAGCSPLCE